MADRWLALSDLLNPIVVKDVRQGLRTRSFTVSFALLLLVSVVISVVSWSAWTPHTTGTPVGEGAFAAYLTCFGFVGFLVLPLSLHRSFAREREAETWQLLVMTGVKPRRILRGKIASGLVQGVLYASAIAPFLLFSYFLQGISLAGILLAVVAAFAWQAFLTTAAVASAAVAEQKAMRSFVGVVWGLALPIGTLMLVSSGASFMAFSRLGGSGPSFDGWVWAVGAWFLVSAAVVLFESAAAKLMSAGENHAIGPRLAVFAHLVGTLGIPFFANTHGAELGTAVLLWGSLVSFTYGVFAVSDADGAGRAVRATRVPRLLWPGASRGFLVALLFEAMTVVAAMALANGGSTFEQLVVLVPAWVVIYLALPVLVCRGLLPDVLGGAAMRFVTLGLAIFALVALPIFFGRGDRELVGLMNPFAAGSETSEALPVMVALLLGVAALVVLGRRSARAEEA